MTSCSASRCASFALCHVVDIDSCLKRDVTRLRSSACLCDDERLRWRYFKRPPAMVDNECYVRLEDGGGLQHSNAGCTPRCCCCCGSRKVRASAMVSPTCLRRCTPVIGQIPYTHTSSTSAMLEWAVRLLNIHRNTGARLEAFELLQRLLSLTLLRP